MSYLILIIVGVVGFVLGRKTAKTFSPKTAETMDNLRKESKEALNERTNHRKERIIEFMKNETARQEKLASCDIEDKKKGITSNDIQKLLEISNGTTRKYLKELESEKKIEQVGISGRDVYYILKD